MSDDACSPGDACAAPPGEYAAPPGEEEVLAGGAGVGVGTLWVASMLVFNVLLDGPFSDTFGAAWRWVAEFLTTGFALGVLAGLFVVPEMRTKLWPISAPLLALVGYIAVQGVFLEVHPVVLGYAARSVLRFPLTVIGVAYLAREEASRRLLLKLLLGLGVIEAGLLVFQYLVPYQPLWDALRPTRDVELGVSTVSLAFSAPFPSGTFPRYNHAAQFLLPLAFLWMAIAARQDRPKGSGWLALLLAAGTFVTCSRTAQLALILGLGVLLARRRLLLVGAGGAALVLVLSLTYGKKVDYAASTESANLLQRYLSAFATSYWETVQEGGELQRWPAAIYGTQGVLERHPWMGTGYGTIGSALTDSAFRETEHAPYGRFNRLPWIEGPISLRAISDVGWVSLLAQGGVLGLLFFGWCFVALVMAARRNARGPSALADACLLTVFSFVAFNVSASAFLSRAFLSSAAVILGLGVAQADVEVHGEQEEEDGPEAGDDPSS